MTLPELPDLFGGSPPVNARSVVNAPRGVLTSSILLTRLQDAAPSLRPAFAPRLTRAERREIFERSIYRQAPLPRPLWPESQLVNLPEMVARRFAAAAPSEREGLPEWLLQPEGPEPETGANEFAVNNPRSKQASTACPEARLGNRGAELHVFGKSLDNRRLRGQVKNKTRALFRRMSLPWKCGLWRHSGEVEIRNRVDRAPDGSRSSRAFVTGLTRCCSVWACPTCAASISGERGRVVSAVVEAHREKTRTADAPGGAVYMVTFTVRHNVSMRLKPLLRTVADAWKRFQQSDWKKLKRRMGFVGSIKALEVTIGANGYHPHLHVLFALDAPLSAVERAEWEAAFFHRWAAALREVSELRGVIPLQFDPATGNPLGVRWDECHDANYLQKLGLAAELTGGADKKANGENRTGFQVAVDFYRHNDESDGQTFKRYAHGMKGARQLTWSRGKDGAHDLRVIYADAIRALDAEPDQPTLTGLESDYEIILREEKNGATVAKMAGPQWDGATRILRAVGVNLETALTLHAERDGAVGVEGLLGYVHSLGLSLLPTRPYLAKYLAWLAPPDPLPAAVL